MSFIRTTLTLLVVFTVASNLCGCAFTLATAKQDIYIQNEKKIRHVLETVLKVPESKISRITTVTSLGMVPGKNDTELKLALEKEFQIELPMDVLERNPRVEDLVTFFSDAQQLHIVPKEKLEDFGPVVPDSNK